VMALTAGAVIRYNLNQMGGLNIRLLFTTHPTHQHKEQPRREPTFCP
jgi:hypothetical protein